MRPGLSDSRTPRLHAAMTTKRRANDRDVAADHAKRPPQMDEPDDASYGYQFYGAAAEDAQAPVQTKTPTPRRRR